MIRHTIRVVLAAIAILIATLTYSPTANATAQCFPNPPEDQFDSTYAIDNQPPPTTFLVGLNGQARFACAVNWRVTFQPLFKLPAASTWTVGFDNSLYMPSANGHYTAFQDVLFTPGIAPPSFTGYWTNGDGLHANHPICQYQWRVRERFTNTGNNTLVGTYYSPTTNPTC